MRSDRDILLDALLILESPHSDSDELTLREEIRTRLANPKLEPRAWVASKSSDGKDDALYWNSRDAEEDGYDFIEPLYHHPPRPNGLDQLLERIRFLEQQIAERKNQ